MKSEASDLRNWHQNISGALALATGDGDQTLVTGRANHTIYIQKIIFTVTTDATPTASFEDSNSSAKVIAEVPASPGEGQLIFDFGDEGVPLTEGKNFVLNLSAAGLGGHIEWLGYMKQSSTMTAAAFAAST